MSLDQDDDSPRATLKKRAIVESACEAFLRNGYLGTSMDEIATTAGVSKQTVYKHFGDKHRLFAHVVRASVREVSTPVHQEVARLAATGDLASDLRAVARRQLELVLQPRLLKLRRLVIAEAARFPELGREFYEQGPARTIAALAAAFTRISTDGALRITDVDVAASQFNWLVMGEALNEAMLLGHDGPFDGRTLDRWAEAGVSTFVAAYGIPARSRRRR